MSKNVSLSIVVLLLVVLVWSLTVGTMHPFSRTATVFVLRPGWNADDVATALYVRGITEKRVLFKAVARLSGLDRAFKAGVYRLRTPSASLPLLFRLSRGGNLPNMVTVPEGLRLGETSEILSARLGMRKKEFLSACRNRDLLSSLGIPGPTAEGFLFPDTYDFGLGSPPESVVAVMIRRALRVFAEEAAGLGEFSPEERYRVFTIGSIVEAETALEEEKPKVSAVYYNRLRRGWKLQADPSVAYALGKRPARLTAGDLRVASPYNTYLKAGLPPGPICSPGRTSIRAALKPLEGFRALYFVARGDGSHVFSDTLEEHLRAKRRLGSGG